MDINLIKLHKKKMKRLSSKRRIGIDQPFDYDEVAAATGSEYIQHVNRDGMACVPYEEVKKNIPGFYLPEDKCVWMRAGIINLKLCDYDYDCYNCPFDLAMRTAMGDKAAPKQKEKAANWAKHVKERYKITATPCIHFLSGRIEAPEECPINYECGACTVHQMLEDKNHMERIEKAGHTNASGYTIMDDYYYHFGHSWVNVEESRRARIGIDDFMSKVLGPVDAINFPPVGTLIKQGEIGCILTRNDKKAPMQSPMSGTVFAVNDKVKKNPELAHDDPYHGGWLYILEAEKIEPELAGLYSDKESFQWMEKESQNLCHLMGPRYEQLAATGGEPIDDVFGNFPEIKWDRLVRTFLRTKKR
jgi:glycine cleavage system H lipoate-binding protein